MLLEPLPFFAIVEKMVRSRVNIIGNAGQRLRKALAILGFLCVTSITIGLLESLCQASEWEIVENKKQSWYLLET